MRGIQASSGITRKRLYITIKRHSEDYFFAPKFTNIARKKYFLSLVLSTGSNLVFFFFF